MSGDWLNVGLGALTVVLAAGVLSLFKVASSVTRFDERLMHWTDLVRKGLEKIEDHERRLARVEDRCEHQHEGSLRNVRLRNQGAPAE